MDEDVCYGVCEHREVKAGRNTYNITDGPKPQHISRKDFALQTATWTELTDTVLGERKGSN